MSTDDNIRKIIADPPIKGVWNDVWPDEYDKDEVRKVIREEIKEALSNTNISGTLIDNTIPQSKIIASGNPTHLVSVGISTAATVDGAYHDYSTAPYVGWAPEFLEGFTEVRINWLIYISALNGCTSLNSNVGMNDVFVGWRLLYGRTDAPPFLTTNQFDSGWIKLPAEMKRATNFVAPGYAYNTGGGNPTIQYQFLDIWVR